MSDETRDKITEFSDAPDMAALHEEYDQAISQDSFAGGSADMDGRLAFVERVRYGAGRGRSRDGTLHLDDARGETGWRYEGMPDVEINLADDIINYGVDLDVTAFWNAQIKTSPAAGRTLNAAQAGELRTLIAWLKYGPLYSDLVRNVEIAAQFRWMIGWCVLHPSWRNKNILKMRRLTMEQIFQLATPATPAPQTQPPPPQPPGPGEGGGGQSLLASLPEMVLNPELEDAAVEMFLQFFPGFDRREARRVIRELRENQEAEFPTEETSSVGPEIGVLCPWMQFVLPVEATARPEDARLGFVIKDIPKWRLEEIAAEEEWTDAEFVKLVKATAGQTTPTPNTKEQARDLNRNMCRVVYAFRRVVKDGAVAMYCTVFCPDVNNKNGEPGAYGKDWNIDLMAGGTPFLFLRLEAADWCITDTRGVCDMVLTQQNEMKTQRDALCIQAELSNTPPIQRIGTNNASKAPSALGPFAWVNSPSGKPYEVLNLTAGSRPELAVSIAEMVRKEAEDRFGVPRSDTPPQRSMLRSQKLVNTGLAMWGEALLQLAMLALQNMDDDELADIFGHKPLLTAEILSRQKVMLSYDTRTGVPDQIKMITDTAQMFIGSGLADDMFKKKFSRWFWNFIDPSAADEFLPEDETNDKQVFDEVRNEVNNIMLGNKLTPMSLVKMDPAARKKLGFLDQIVKTNPAYAMQLIPQINGQENPNFHPAKREALDTLRKNLQHSFQETVLSKAQGVLGVKDVGQQG